jgi:Lon protease-like protein
MACGHPSPGGSGNDARFESVPLFPLPNVVLFPRAVLPLHIFEERYKAMTADAISGRRRIAMALLKPGWEKNYYGRAAIEPVVCLGEILAHEQLDDGKYNFLLQGSARARIVRELPEAGKPYRVADLEPLAEIRASDEELAAQRRRLNDLLRADVAAFLPGAEQFLQMLASPLPTESVADLIAFHLLDDLMLKHALLVEPDVRRRVARTIDALRELHPPAGADEADAPAAAAYATKGRPKLGGDGYPWN